MSIQQTTSHCCGQQMSRLYPIEIKEYPILGIFVGSKFISPLHGEVLCRTFIILKKSTKTSIPNKNKKHLNNCYSIYYKKYSITKLHFILKKFYEQNATWRLGLI
jgi:hypothetical protein